MPEPSEDLKPNPKEVVKSKILKISDLPSSVSPPEFSSNYHFPVPAIVITNEVYNPKLYEDLRNKYKPTGIIYGPGVGNIFTMVEGFAPTTPPQGIVMVDINPAVILAAKILIDGFRKNTTWRDFAVNILFQRDTKKLAQEIVENETDPNLKKVFGDKAIDRYQLAMQEMIRELTRYPAPKDIVEFPFDDYQAYLRNATVPITAIARFYPLLHQMAIQGNMKAIYSDIFEPTLLEDVGTLSGASSNNNLIYTSNIAEVSMPDELRSSEDPKELSTWVDRLNQRLRGLETLKPKSPGRNIYVREKTYGDKHPKLFKLSVQTRVPQYSMTYFRKS